MFVWTDVQTKRWPTEKSSINKRVQRFLRTSRDLGPMIIGLGQLARSIATAADSGRNRRTRDINGPFRPVQNVSPLIVELYRVRPNLYSRVLRPPPSPTTTLTGNRRGVSRWFCQRTVTTREEWWWSVSGRGCFALLKRSRRRRRENTTTGLKQCDTQ